MLKIFVFVLVVAGLKLELSLGTINVKGMQTRNVYVIMEGMATWLEAFTECDEIEGRLVPAMNPELDNELRQFLVEESFSGDLWLGGRVTVEREWKWEVNNVIVSWSNFRNISSCSETIVGNCLKSSTATEEVGWAWCGVPCSNNLPFVCQFEENGNSTSTTITTTTATSTTTATTSTTASPTTDITMSTETTTVIEPTITTPVPIITTTTTPTIVTSTTTTRTTTTPRMTITTTAHTITPPSGSTTTPTTPEATTTDIGNSSAVSVALMHKFHLNILLISVLLLYSYFH